MKGIVPSLNTPFLEDGALDFASLRRLVDHTVSAGCGGMLGLAVAGEHTALTFDEKAQYIDTVTHTNAERIPFIVSVTSQEPADSIALAKLATKAKAAGLCVQLPARMDHQGHKEFLQDLAAQGPEILMVQDLDWAGGGLALDDIVHLFNAIETFTWLKIETVQAGAKYSAVLKATNGALNVCGGWAVSQLMDAMQRGVQAFIPSGMEHTYVEIYTLYQSGNIKAARALFERVLPILNFSNQHIDASIRFFKDLRKAEGVFTTNICRQAGELDPVQQTESDYALSLALALNHAHRKTSKIP